MFPQPVIYRTIEKRPLASPFLCGHGLAEVRTIMSAFGRLLREGTQRLFAVLDRTGLLGPPVGEVRFGGRRRSFQENVVALIPDSHRKRGLWLCAGNFFADAGRIDMVGHSEDLSDMTLSALQT
jgi:hypothetical protein